MPYSEQSVYHKFWGNVRKGLKIPLVSLGGILVGKFGALWARGNLAGSVYEVGRSEMILCLVC
jgi:hypothetical protein